MDIAQKVLRMIPAHIGATAAEYGLSLAETARRLGISTSGVAQILRRSEGV
jgi:lambda repressor-like predicted transcriptional regulator